MTRKLADVLDGLTQAESPKFAEIPAAVYDDMYKTGGAGGNYFAPYQSSRYIAVWTRALKMLSSKPHHSKIIDIGCGPGQFANMLLDHGYTNYQGLDFSTEAIKMAKRTNPRYASCFRTGDAFATELLDPDNPYDIVIFFEILEHLENDLALVKRVRPGTMVLLSVPNFDDPNHVRLFHNEQEVQARYADLLSIKKIEAIPLNPGYTIFLAKGIKK